MTDPFTKALRAQMKRNDEAAAFKISAQRQREAKELTANLDRLDNERFLETSRNFLQQEQDHTK